MKKVLFIFFGSILLTLNSCQKEEINPREQQDTSVKDESEMQKMQDIYSFDTEDNHPQKSAYGGNGIMNSGSPSDSSFVTDPNRDEDEERKVKRKNN